MTNRKRIEELFLPYTVSIIAIILTLIPIYWLLITSLKKKKDSFTRPPKFIFEPTFENFIKVWNNDFYAQTIFNSLLITLIGIIISIFIALLCAYGLKRYKIKFKSAFMKWLLVAYMLPEFLFVLPMYSIYQSLGIYDTHFGLALMYQVHVLPFSIWMLRSFFDEIPSEIDDAALIDGCRPLTTLFKIYVPIVIPGIVATSVLNAIWMWNELAIAIGLTFSEAHPVTLGISQFRGYASIDWGGMTASSVIALVPLILFSLFAQKHIVKGLTLGSVKA